jgi:hypothetical protein
MIATTAMAAAGHKAGKNRPQMIPVFVSERPVMIVFDPMLNA